MKSGKIFFIAFIFFTIASCHKVQIIRPPEGGGSVTFSGKGEFKSNLLVENRIPTSNTNPSSLNHDLQWVDSRSRKGQITSNRAHICIELQNIADGK